jgi:hypothetical protein
MPERKRPDPNTVSTSQAAIGRDQLIRSRDLIQRNYETSRGEIRHAMRLEGEGGLVDTFDPAVLIGSLPGSLTATSPRPCVAFEKRKPPRGTARDEHVQGGILCHTLYVTAGSERARDRFVSEAKDLVSQVTQSFRSYNSDYRLLTNIWRYEAILGTSGSWVLWMHALYNLAWDFPNAAGYRVEGFSRPHDDPSLQVGGLPRPPFTERASLENWGRLETTLPEGDHWLWLSQDVRLCTVCAIDAVLNGLRSCSPPESLGRIKKNKTSECVHDIILTLQEAQRPLKRTEMIQLMNEKERRHGPSTIGNALSALVKAGELTNQGPGRASKGYGLPEWDATKH